jgi:hypothetical protein
MFIVLYTPCSNKIEGILKSPLMSVCLSVVGTFLILKKIVIVLS